jgi:hypothetical protein
MANEELDLQLSDNSEAPAEVFSEFEQKVIAEESIDQLAKMYRDVYDDVEEFGKQLRRLESKKAALGEQFCKVLLANGLNSVKTDEGSFAPKVDHCVSIIESDRAFEVIESHGHGAAIKRKIEWMTLNKIHREDPGFAEAVKNADEGVFKTWDKHGIRIRRSND